MTREQVESRLKNYRIGKARIAHLEAMIEQYKLRVPRELEEAHNEEAVRAVRYTGMPHGTDIQSPVEDEAEKRLNGEPPQIVKILLRDIHGMERERDELALSIRCVDAWMSGLRERERFVVEMHLMEGECWKDVQRAFGERYGYELTREGLKRMKERALERIYAVAA